MNITQTRPAMAVVAYAGVPRIVPAASIHAARDIAPRADAPRQVVLDGSPGQLFSLLA